MRYRNFDSFKINEALMNSTNFGNIEIESEKCEQPIFNHFKNYKFALVSKSGKVFVYSNSERIIYKSLDEMFDREGDVSDRSIKETENGISIMSQYEKLSKLTIVDIYQIPYTPKTKSGSSKFKKKEYFNPGFIPGGGYRKEKKKDNDPGEEEEPYFDEDWN